MNTTKLGRWVAVAATFAHRRGGNRPAQRRPAEEGTRTAAVGLVLVGGRGRRPDALLEQYAADSGVNVTFEPQPEYDTALQAALSAGDPPDFFYVDSVALAGSRRRRCAGPRSRRG